MTTTEQMTFLDYFDDLREAGAIDDLGLDLGALGEMTYEQWEALGVYLGRTNSAIRWALGDWLNFGEASFGEKYAQAMEATGLRLQTLKNYAWVSGAVARSRRRDTLSWSHHESVAGLAPREQRTWLDRAEREGWNVETLREEIRAERDAEPGSADSDEPAERQSLSDVARSVWISSSRHGEVYHVPVETMLRLARALGEPV